MSASFLSREDTEFDNVYRQAARSLAAGEDFYPARDGYVYPPFAAWLALPVADLPTLPARAIWLAINLLACGLMIRAAWQVARGGALLGPDVDLREHGIFWCGLATAGFYLLNAFNHTQTDIVIGALVMAGCLAVCRGQSLTAACWFGLASAFKCTPLLWAAYFVWRGRFLAAATVLVVFVGVNLLPNLAAPSPHGGWWLTYWSERYLAGASKPSAEVGAWHTSPRYNQSLNGAVQRLFFLDPGYSDEDGDLHETPRAHTVDRQAVKFATLAFEVALVLGCLIMMGRCGIVDLTLRVKNRYAERGACDPALDCSIIGILMLLLSPMSGKAHFGLLILPGFCLARMAIMERNRSAMVVLVLSVPLILAGRLLTGKPGLYALWWGNVTWHTIVLLTGCLLALRRNPAQAAFSCHADVVRRAA